MVIIFLPKLNYILDPINQQDFFFKKKTNKKGGNTNNKENNRSKIGLVGTNQHNLHENQRRMQRKQLNEGAKSEVEDFDYQNGNQMQKQKQIGHDDGAFETTS